MCVKLNVGLRNTKNYGCEYHLYACVYPQGPWAQATQERAHRRVRKYHHRYYPPARHGPEPTLVAELGSTRSVYSASTVCLQQRQETYSPRLLPERITAFASPDGAHYKRSYRLLPERQDTASVSYQSALFIIGTYVCNVVPSPRSSRNVFSSFQCITSPGNNLC